MNLLYLDSRICPVSESCLSLGRESVVCRLNLFYFGTLVNIHHKYKAKKSFKLSAAGESRFQKLALSKRK